MVENPSDADASSASVHFAAMVRDAGLMSVQSAHMNNTGNTHCVCV
jgi:hypothetical protein